MDNNFYEEAENNGEEIEYFKFYTNEKCAFLKGGRPGCIVLMEYMQKYIISVVDECMEDDCMPAPDEFYDRTIYETYEEAKRHCIELQAKGIQSGKEQISECISKINVQGDIRICPEKHIYGIYFSVYYKKCLLIEHMRGLDSNVIAEAVQVYENFCEKYKISIFDISKTPKEWKTNQRYYRIDFYDKTRTPKCYKAHIPSIMRGSQRQVIHCIKEKQFEAFLKENEK